MRVISMENSKSFLYGNSEDESKSFTIFGQSLQELKDLRSQLYRAADFCEESFCTAENKKIIVGNTKEYVCKAVVTVVDHLGSVSANLESAVSNINTVSQVELRIDCLKQKISTCQEYARNQTLRKVCWNANFPRYHLRYIAPPTPNFHISNNEVERNLNPAVEAKSRVKRVEFENEEQVPLFFYTCNYKPSLVDNKTKISTQNSSMDKNHNLSPAVLPVRGGMAILQARPEIHSFDFQEGRKIRRQRLQWKSMQNNDFLWVLRRSKRFT